MNDKRRLHSAPAPSNIIRPRTIARPSVGERREFNLLEHHRARTRRAEGRADGLARELAKADRLLALVVRVAAAPPSGVRAASTSLIRRAPRRRRSAGSPTPCGATAPKRPRVGAYGSSRQSYRLTAACRSRPPTFPIRDRRLRERLH